jgi:hypothetical protein
LYKTAGAKCLRIFLDSKEKAKEHGQVEIQKNKRDPEGGDIMKDWLEEVRGRLLAGGFVLLPDDASADDTPFTMVARRSRFELTKFGFSETFFLFAEFDALNPDRMRRFSADAFRTAKQLRKIGLPCGLFESVWSYAVAMCPTVDEATRQAVQNEAPPKHWAAAEIPVIYDSTQGKLYYFEKTPLWGAAYYRGFRKEIGKFLGGA